MHRFGLALLAGCGRLGFESTEGGIGNDASSDSSLVDGPTADAPVDAMIDAPTGGQMTFTFGEAPITQFKTVTRDTYISSEAGESLFNFGADDEIRIEMDAGERALIRFDLTAIPTNATIVSALLALTFTQIPLVPLEINLHRVNEPWDEGDANGTGGAANFTFRTSILLWTNPGAAPGTSSSLSPFTNFTPALGPKSIPIPAAAVQAWVASPQTNFGMIMISTSGESTRLRTSEAIATSERPVLTVTFTP